MTTKNLSDDKNNSIAADFLSGAAAGFFSGAIIAPTEYAKVLLQTMPNSEWRAALTKPETYRTASKAILPFSMISSSVCALEFSINKRIGHSYGEMAGISASALTGAFYLTAADHLLFRRQKGEEASDALKKLFKIRRNAVWTGFSPMIGREAIFISSVMHLGPALGSKLNSGSEKDSILWSSLGRFITGVSTTLISQPFDVLARDMQVQLYNNPTKQPSLLHSFKRTQNEFGANDDKKFITKHPLFRGAVPRMGLATVGGVLAGGFFDGFRKSIDNMDEVEIIENVTPLQSTRFLEKDHKPKRKNSG